MDKPGRINLRTLAEHLSLSQTTVSVVLNNAPAAQAIPEQTRDRVLNAARELNYRPSFFARSLSKSSSMSVGILAPEISEGYVTLVMNGLQEYLFSHRYFYYLVCHNWSDQLVAECPQMLIERSVDGFVFINTPIVDTLPLPAVAISGHQHIENVTNVHLDHVAAAELAIAHLTQLGHRRIAFMRGQHSCQDTDHRWRSIMKAAAYAGLPVHPELTMHLDSDISSPEIGYSPTKRLLTRTRDFTAMFCFNDMSAIGALRALHEAGLRVPEDVSVMGFDDIQAARYSTPSLTTICQPLRRMGEVAAETLLERLRDPKSFYPPEILLAPELIVRESTAVAAA